MYRFIYVHAYIVPKPIILGETHNLQLGTISVCQKSAVGR